MPRVRNAWVRKRWGTKCLEALQTRLRGAHRVQNRGRTVHIMKFIKTGKFKSDSNFEIKMAFAAIDLIISKKRDLTHV